MPRSTSCLIDGTLNFLLGRWWLARAIYDRRSGTSPRFTGEAVVSRLGAGEAGYEEWGAFTDDNGYHGRARRSLIYRSEFSSVRVHFPNGRRFHDLDLTGGACNAEHACGADLYSITFLVLDDDTLIERWQVRGPAKAYDARTCWRRGVTSSIRASPDPTLGDRIVDEEQA